eukprot:1180661-Rhodomonas_salina.1
MAYAIGQYGFEGVKYEVEADGDPPRVHSAELPLLLLLYLDRLVQRLVDLLNDLRAPSFKVCVRKVCHACFAPHLAPTVLRQCHKLHSKPRLHHLERSLVAPDEDGAGGPVRREPDRLLARVKDRHVRGHVVHRHAGPPLILLHSFAPAFPGWP